jgi:hypothetical protein
MRRLLCYLGRHSYGPPQRLAEDDIGTRYREDCAYCPAALLYWKFRSLDPGESVTIALPADWDNWDETEKRAAWGDK